MCVAVPGEILSVDADGIAEVDFGGIRRSVSLSLLDGVGEGDFVIVHAGFALHRIDADEARETRAMMAELLGADNG